MHFLAMKFLSHEDRHTHTHTHKLTDRIFSKNGQIVFKTSQNVYIYQKSRIENLHETDTFCAYIEESKNYVNNMTVYGIPKTIKYIPPMSFLKVFLNSF